MRQAGIVAAAGLYALDNCVARLADDHRNAERIAYAIRQTGSDHVTADPETVRTNILLVNVNSSVVNASDFVSELSKVQDDEDSVRSTAVRISQVDDANVRIVLHKDVEDEHVDMAIEKIKYVIGMIDRGAVARRSS